MAYIDSFVVPVMGDKLDEYKKMARQMAKLLIKHGALSVMECVEDDVAKGKTTSYPQSVKLKEGEVVVISWITYKNRKERDKVMKLAMEEPLMANFDPKTAPFDGKRMFWGGFKPIITATASEA